MSYSRTDETVRTRRQKWYHMNTTTTPSYTCAMQGQERDQKTMTTSNNLHATAYCALGLQPTLLHHDTATATSTARALMATTRNTAAAVIWLIPFRTVADG